MGTYFAAHPQYLLSPEYPPPGKIGPKAYFFTPMLNCLLTYVEGTHPRRPYMIVEDSPQLV